MKFNASFALLAAALASISSASPLSFNEDDQITVPIQVPFSSSPKFLTFPNWFGSTDDGDDGDVCPDLPVSCVKDGKVIGDIGTKPFKRQGLSCEQAHKTKNAAECNTKYLVHCKTRCEARGPLGGKLAPAESAYDRISESVHKLAADGDEGDICPDMKVSCKDKDGKSVGSLGKKPFCRDGLTCHQCHQTENTAACNAKFLVDCKAQCEATGPLGGKSVFVYRA
ncbi:hypothetical protein BCV70DRAFT_190809 [Testicularia cyperi]|uniref:Uncharacterized protein n=1 Tax=Testicularia cyperi TaxID=1882483 RepID=A0A317XPI9_9BASI|nr:hypothetical protein BCV70DRAFT_190809 [Testicularia cyperi]